MKESKDKKLNAWINKTHRKYQDILGLNLWEFEILISSVNCKDDRNENVITAEIKQSQSYMNYTITLYPIFVRMFNKKQYTKCEYILVHEMCHVITEPLYDIAITHCSPAENPYVERERERLTEILSKMVKEYGTTK